MNYQALPYPTVQAMYDRIALLEWFMRQGEHDEMDEIELTNLRSLAKSCTVKRPQRPIIRLLTWNSSCTK